MELLAAHRFETDEELVQNAHCLNCLFESLLHSQDAHVGALLEIEVSFVVFEPARAGEQDGRGNQPDE
jgi:hypothetical protein